MKKGKRRKRVGRKIIKNRGREREREREKEGKKEREEGREIFF